MSNNKQTVRAWDLPTRLFHWLLVILIINAYLTYEFGDINMTYHMWNGYALLTLILFRLFWGLWGSSTARFAHFIKGPSAIISYIKSMHSPTPKKFLGHNPAGALMVIALLSLIIIQGTMGLFTSDDILVEGPLASKVSSDFVEFAGFIHAQAYWVIVGFAGFHVFAVFFYLFVKKENLIKAMVTGKKASHDAPDNQSLNEKPLFLAIFSLILSAGIIWLIVTW